MSQPTQRGPAPSRTEPRRANTTDTNSTPGSGPYGVSANAYLASGIGSPLPLPARRKAHPPTGWTGAAAPYPSGADVAEWAESDPDGNVGLRFARNVVGLDVDAYDKTGKIKDENKLPAVLTMRSAIAECGALPDTVVSTSRGVGRSGIRFFRVPDSTDTSRFRDLGPGVETIRASHRYAVVAPSIHPEGGVYTWYSTLTGERLDGPPSLGDLPLLPAAWIARLVAPVAAAHAPARTAEGLQYGDLSTTMRSRVDGHMRGTLEGFTADLAKVAALPEGATVALGNGAARGWEAHIGQDLAIRALRLDTAGWTGLAESTFTQTLTDASADPVWRSLVAEKLATKAEWAADLGPAPEPAWISEPEAISLDQMAGTPSSGLGQVAGPANPAPMAADDANYLDAMHRGQTRIAYRLAALHGRKLMHVAGVGWHRWDGKRWAYDRDNAAAHRLLLDTLRSSLAELVGMSRDRADELLSDVRKIEGASAQEGTLRIAGRLEGIAADADDLDADPNLLNVANGTLDLRTGVIKDHDPADRITKVCRANYDPAARSDLWDAFLTRVLPDPDVRAFLARYVGQALLGEVIEHILAILTGEGRNGKGSLYAAVSHALGDYSIEPDPDLFMARRDAHPTGQMDLRGARWAVVSESDDGRRLAEATLKRLTGGDRITARRMGRDFVSFDPSHTAILVTNHLPSVTGDDPALWARLRVVPFDVVIPPAERDGALGRKLRAEADAVLAWAVAGWVDYLNRGSLAEPSAVLAATDAYHSDADSVGRFLAERTMSNPNAGIAVGDLYEAWARWCAEEGIEALSKKALGTELDRRGYATKAGSMGGPRQRRGLYLYAHESD